MNSQSPHSLRHAVVGVLLASLALGPFASPARAALMGHGSQRAVIPQQVQFGGTWVPGGWDSRDRDTFVCNQFGFFRRPEYSTSEWNAAMLEIVRRGVALELAGMRGTGDASDAAIERRLWDIRASETVARQVSPFVVFAAREALEKQQTHAQQFFAAQFDLYFAEQRMDSSRRMLDAWHDHARSHQTAGGGATFSALLDTGPSLAGFKPQGGMYGIGFYGQRELMNRAVSLDPNLRSYGFSGTPSENAGQALDFLKEQGIDVGPEVASGVLWLTGNMDTEIGQGVIAGFRGAGAIRAIVNVLRAAKGGPAAFAMLAAQIAVTKTMEVVKTMQFLETLEEQASTVFVHPTHDLLMNGSDVDQLLVKTFLDKMIIADPADAGFYEPRTLPFQHFPSIVGSWMVAHPDESPLVDFSEEQLAALPPEILRQLMAGAVVYSDSLFSQVQAAANKLPEVRFHAQNFISLQQAKQVASQNGWSVATPWQVAGAWLAQDLERFAFGMMSDGRFAVPVQADMPGFQFGPNIGASGGNQGFFYVEGTSSGVPEVTFHHHEGLNLSQAISLAHQQGRRLATAREVLDAWSRGQLDAFAYGRMAGGGFAVPIQASSGGWRRGPNLYASGGNQGYFTVPAGAGDIGFPSKPDGTCNSGAWRGSDGTCYEGCKTTATRHGNSIPRVNTYWCNYGSEAPLGTIGQACLNGGCGAGAWCHGSRNRCYESCRSTSTRHGNSIPRASTYWCDYGGETPL